MDSLSLNHSKNRLISCVLLTAITGLLWATGQVHPTEALAEELNTQHQDTTCNVDPNHLEAILGAISAINGELTRLRAEQSALRNDYPSCFIFGPENSTESCQKVLYHDLALAAEYHNWEHNLITYQRLLAELLTDCGEVSHR